jgi:hypothetical protein
MDPAFHIAAQSLKSRTKQVGALPPETVREMGKELAGIMTPKQRGQVLCVLRTANKFGGMGEEETQAILDKYPILSLVLLETNMAEIDYTLKQEIAEREAKRETLGRLQGVLGKTMEDDSHKVRKLRTP